MEQLFVVYLSLAFLRLQTCCQLVQIFVQFKNNKIISYQCSFWNAKILSN